MDSTGQQAFESAGRSRSAGRWEEAESLYRQVLAAEPNHADSLHLLGLVVYEQRRLNEAVELIRRAINVDPTRSDYPFNLGLILLELDESEQAIASFQQSLALRNDFFEARFNLANTFFKLGRLEEAIAGYQSALVLQPNHAASLNNLGNSLYSAGHWDEAIPILRRAREDAQCAAEANFNLGNALKAARQFDEAEAAYRQAIAIRPDFAAAHWNLSLLLLLQGKFSEGWREYEWRWRASGLPPIPPQVSQNPWDGRDLAGKRILIFTEQGFGDTIQFARFIPLVAQRGGKIVLGCQPELLRLFHHFDEVDQLVSVQEPLPQTDLFCFLMSLPRIFETTLQNIPATTPYLKIDASQKQKWKNRLGDDDKRLKVGLAWAGRPRHGEDHLRSVSLANLAPLARIPGIRFFSLQKWEAARQIRELAPDIEMNDWTEDLKDFADTAALIDQLDLIISVDTAVAHLAGALAKPVWVLLPAVPEWRWMLDRPDSPWYPTMRLFRQTIRADWSGPIRQIAAALREWVGP
jgi:Tfp pilus assembly protein PilF